MTLPRCIVFVVALAGCRTTSHPLEPSALGGVRGTSALEALLAQPGPVVVETIIGADWEVYRAGLINLEHPKALAAGLKDGFEPVHIAFHAIRHPTRGLYIVDTGVERALRDDPDHAAIQGLVAGAMHLDRMKFRTDTRSWLSTQRERLAGVFLTHLHLDHVSGMRDVPNSAPIYTGPGEKSEHSFENFFIHPVIDAALEGKGPLRVWPFAPDPDGAFEGVLDIFGDGTVWALHVPGHTPGSTAYLARTPKGPVLFVGDACHTAWGWKNGVEPGSFSSDVPRSRESLGRLKRFVVKHPEIDVRLGHQVFTP